MTAASCSRCNGSGTVVSVDGEAMDCNCTYEQPAAIMLRDEALDLLASKIEDDVRAKLEVSVDHGQFEAHYIYRPQGDGDAGVSVVSGELSPSLTNALVSLAEKLS